MADDGKRLFTMDSTADPGEKFPTHVRQEINQVINNFLSVGDNGVPEWVPMAVEGVGIAPEVPSSHLVAFGEGALHGTGVANNDYSELTLAKVTVQPDEGHGSGVVAFTNNNDRVYSFSLDSYGNFQLINEPTALAVVHVDYNAPGSSLSLNETNVEVGNHLSVGGDLDAESVTTQSLTIDLDYGIPETASSPGTPGRVAADEDYIYLCVGENSWKRATLETW